MLVDNDAAIKLAQLGLFDLFLESFALTYQDLLFIPELRYVAFLGDKDKGVEKIGVSGWESLRTVFFSGQVIQIDPDDSLANELLEKSLPGLDVGELVLLAAAKSNELPILTGDKRAVLAIPAEEPYLHCQGRLVLIEQVILKIITESQSHFEVVSKAVHAAPEVDKALSICFGVSEPSSLEACVSGLGSYIQYVRKNANGAFLIQL